MFKTILSIIFWLVIILLTVILFFVVLIMTLFTFWFEKKRRLQHSQCFWWSDAVIGVNPFWRVRTHGMANIDPRQKYVVVCNHQSFADIVLLYQTRMQFKWVAKDSLFRVPFIGWCLSLTRHIQLKRGQSASIRYVYRQASMWLDEGMSVLFFPEGTRSETAPVQKFYTGAFRLALKKKVPVLPIAIQGTGRALPKGTWKIRPCADIHMTILPAISTDTYGAGDYRNLMDTAKKQIQNELGSNHQSDPETIH